MAVMDCAKYVVGGKRPTETSSAAGAAAAAALQGMQPQMPYQQRMPSKNIPGDRSTNANVMRGYGFSMEDAVAHADAEHSKAASRTPAEVLADLQRGNTRFWTNTAMRPEASAFERRALISKQFPSVAVLGCSDSRVPTEIVFDQGLGDLFTIRVAGNVLDAATVASLQYAVHHLKVKVVVVLGHELCGAVKAALLPTSKLDGEPPELAAALKSIKAGLDDQRLNHLQDNRALDREAVTTNVKKQVEKITKDTGIMRKVTAGEVLVVGAFYEISSGIVDFFHEVSTEFARQPTAGVDNCYVAKA